LNDLKVTTYHYVIEEILITGILSQRSLAMGDLHRKFLLPSASPRGDNLPCVINFIAFNPISSLM